MIDVHVASCTDEAKDIRRFELIPLNGDSLPAFSAGAHIDVHLPGGIIRQYSLCNPASERHRYVIGVLKDPVSRGGSLAMHEQVRAGDKLTISEPRNLFPLETGADRHLLFAGGIGITPLLCMADHLAGQGADFELHYCTRSEDRAAFLTQLKTAAFRDRVFIHFDDGPQNQKLDASSVLGNPDAGTHLYVCGPGGFMEHILGTARTQGWEEKNLHREYFAASPQPEPDTANDSFEVQIHSTGQILEIPADRTIVQVLEAAGVDVEVSCEQGICGTCLTRVLDGEPDHRDLFMTDGEHALNDQMTICCSRSRSRRLVLDL